MADKKIKVAVICHFSNEEINGILKPILSLSLKDKMALYLSRKEISTDIEEFAVWNTNAVKELEKYTQFMDFHIILPYPYLTKEVYSWTASGIHYHAFRNDYLLESFLHRHILKFIKLKYTRNRQRVKEIIKAICPDVVHLIGVENPYYSLCLKDVPSNIPTIVQLQTLLNDPKFEANYNMSHSQYLYRAAVERDLINRADYIGTTVPNYRKIITEYIKKTATFVDTTLAVSEPIYKKIEKTQFDFVYYARDISKAVDWAIESFAIIHNSQPERTLLIVGGFSQTLKDSIDHRISELGLNNNVFFTGTLPSHDDVINNIKKAKVALLPIKIDYITGTIREAMACGLPVVTTITQGTPLLNKNRKTVLLSDCGDFDTFAANALNVVNDEKLAAQLTQNGYETLKEKYNNEIVIEKWVTLYKSIVNM